MDDLPRNPVGPRSTLLPRKPGALGTLISRPLHPRDVPALLQLESRQWDAQQAATESMLVERMAAHPELCAGTFCPHSGEALSSLFLCPIERENVLRMRSWEQCSNAVSAFSSTAAATCSRSLFGISLTSIDPQAMKAMEAYVWPRVLRLGWRELFLGSPMPGLRRALAQDPSLTAKDYALGRHRGLPRDVQLRYYHQKGLTDIMAVLPGYFPHSDSLDYGVLLRGDLMDIAARSCDVQALLTPAGAAAEPAPREALLA